MYVLDDMNDNIPPALENTFQLIANSHDYLTRNVSAGLNSIKFQSCQDWNFFINHFKDNFLHTKSKSACKFFLTDFFFNRLKIPIDNIN